MLTLTPQSMIQLLCREYLFSSGMSMKGGTFYICPRVSILGAHRQYQFSWKPIASRKNFCGNRSTDHYQLYGSVAGLREISTVVSNLRQFAWAPGYTFSELITPSTEAHFSDFDRGDNQIVRYGCWGTGGNHYYGYLNSQWVPSRGYSFITSYVVYWRWDGTYVHQSGVSVPSPHAVYARHPLDVEWAALAEFCKPATSLRRQSMLINPTFDPTAGLKSSQLVYVRDSLIRWAKTIEPDDDPYILGEATQKAANSAKYFQGNTASYLSELVHLRESLADLKQLLGGNVTLKSLSSLYLQSQYGLKLTLLDTMELGKALARYFAEDHTPKLFSVVRGRETSQETGDIAGCKLYYDPNTANGLAKAVKGLMDWDLFPTFVNVWDIVPYSFVVDWFADVEGFLSAHDAHTYLSVLNVFSALYTYKKEWSAWFPGCAYAGEDMVRVTRFRRWSQPTCIEPTPHFNGSLPWNHIPEGAALIIQSLQN